MECPTCKTKLKDGELVLYDIHGSVEFNCKCGGRLVVRFWPMSSDGISKATCIFEASGKRYILRSTLKTDNKCL